MYLAMHTWMRAEPIEAAIRRIGPLGYEALEISGEPERHDVDEVRRLLSEHGIRCFGAVTLMLGERNLLASNEGQRAQSIAYVNDCITMIEVPSSIPSMSWRQYQERLARGEVEPIAPPTHV